LFGITPDNNRFEHVSVIKVARTSEAITEAIVRALRARTSDGAEWTAAEWLRWYEREKAAETRG
ncbi:MAG TPA: hypothetical protein VGC54_06640, partial [Planctomycetota bacterium]